MYYRTTHNNVPVRYCDQKGILAEIEQLIPVRYCDQDGI